MKTPIVNRGTYTHMADGKIAQDGDHYSLSLHFKNKTPRWQRYGPGHASLDINGCAGPGWLAIDTQEFAEKSSKRTMITLDRSDVERLRDLCDMVLGDTKLATLEQIARLSETADRKLVDVASMCGDIARAAIAKATA